MSDDLATLETQRSKLLEEFLGLGDLRPAWRVQVQCVSRACRRFQVTTSGRWLT